MRFARGVADRICPVLVRRAYPWMERSGGEPRLFQRRRCERFAELSAGADHMAQYRFAGRRSLLANRFEPVAADAARERRPAVRALDQSAIAAGKWNEGDRVRRQLAAGEMRLEAEEV